MSKSVYVVTTGEYSDYRIRGIFSTLELAKEFMANCSSSEACWNKDFNPVETMELDSGLKEKEYVRHYAEIHLDNGEDRRPLSSQETWGVPETEIQVAENVPAYGGRSVVRVWSHKSQEHAHKIAVEARQKWLRENAAKVA